MILSSFFTVAFFSHQIMLPPGDGPLDNPMKGFASYCDPGRVLSCPSEMAFEETGWDQLEPQEGHYTFDRWESTLWNVMPAKDKHIVIRVYLDYPSQPSSVPKWLVKKGVKMTPYSEFGGGLTPDYENPELRRSMLKLIAAMGNRYDHDPRIDFVQVGLLGHWGEWHTYPHENLFASPSVQKEVIAALHKAFPDKPLMARNASYPSCQVPWIGFHDDMIPSDTFGKDDWEFLPAIEKGGVSSNWKVAATGGEMVPGAAKQYLNSDWDLLMRSVKDAHFTWIGPYCPAMEAELSPQDHERVKQLIRALGYQYQLHSASFPPTLPMGAKALIRFKGENQGVAPFYQPWKIKMALIDESQNTQQVWNVAGDVRKWLPGSFEVTTTPVITAPPGRYRLAVGILNPATGKPEIKFANRLERIGGYTILGSVEVVKPLTN